MSLIPPGGAGRKRAHSLDLQEIASAIRNLPADVSALIPSPVLESVLPLAKKQKQGPAQMTGAPLTSNPPSPQPTLQQSPPPHSPVPPAAAASSTTEASPSDAVFQRALALAIQNGTRRMQHDRSLGSYGEHSEETAVLLRRLARERTARQTRTVDVLDDAGLFAVDGESVQILAQSLLSSSSSTRPTPNPGPPGPATPPLQAYIACQRGTIWLWTRYYKGVWSSAADRQVSFQPPQGGSMVDQTSSVADTTPTTTTTTRSAEVAFDLISSVASCPELILQVCCSLRLRDILVLYRVSRVFKRMLDAALGANVLFLARHLVAPDTLAIFPWRLYRRVAKQMPPSYSSSSSPSSPSARPRFEPTLRYLGLLVSRERKVRDILACLARAGHRLPRPAAASTLKKMWLLLDVATNRGRVALLHNEALFTDADLLHMVMFYVKLVLHFHEPLYGPNHRLPPNTVPPGPPGPPGPLPNNIEGATASTETASETAAAVAAQDLWRRVAAQPSHPLVETLLGQRGGLHVLWALLRNKQYRTAREVIELKVRYDYLPPPEALSGVVLGGSGLRHPENGTGGGQPPSVDINDYPPGNSSAADTTPPGLLHDAIHAVPLWEMGVGHLEGWGLGTQHLFRPDELAFLEAERRRRADPASHLDLQRHIPLMAVWGYRDFSTGENLVPTPDELYMSDDSDSDGNDCEDNDTVGDAALEALFPSLSTTAAPTAEQRLARHCGNVPFRPGEWKPWQVLKKQWDTLSLQDRLDIWWISHQERLKNQAWGKEALEIHGADQELAAEAAKIVADVDGSDEKPIPLEYEVYKENFQFDDDSGVDDDDQNNHHQDHPESPAGSPPRFSFAGRGGHHVSSSTFSTASTTVHFDPRRASGVGDDGGSGPSSSRTVSGISASSTAVFSAAPSLSSSAFSRASSTYAADTASGALSTRDRRLVAAFVRSALRAHDAVDAALVAQADESYDEYDLILWEQTLAAAGNDILSESESGTDDDDADNGDNDSSDLDSNASIDTAAAAPRPPLLTTHTVLTPAYGGDDDAMQLLRRLQKAEAGLAAAEARLQEATAEAAADQVQTQTQPQTQVSQVSPFSHPPPPLLVPTPAMVEASRHRTRRQDERGWLQKKLERQIRAEVFAMRY